MDSKTINTPAAAEEKRDRAKELGDTLDEGARDVMGSEERFKGYLDAVGRHAFNGMPCSPRNAALMFLQKEDASFAAGYDEWKEYGRQVSKGAKGMRVFAPAFVQEKEKGELARTIKAALAERLGSLAPGESHSRWRLAGTSVVFTMDRSGKMGCELPGKTQAFANDAHFNNFAARLIGREPTGWKAITVFDISDTHEPEHLFVKSTREGDEIAPDDSGQPVMNARGEVRIKNSPERKARLANDFTEKSGPRELGDSQLLVLRDALKLAAERNGHEVVYRPRKDDPLFGVMESGRNPYSDEIAIDKSLPPKERAAALLREMARAAILSRKEATSIYEDLCDSQYDGELAAELATRAPSLKEIQAEAAAYAVGRKLGLEMPSSSFKHLASLAKEMEPAELIRSMDAIARNASALTGAIESALAVIDRGHGLDLGPLGHERDLLAIDPGLHDAVFRQLDGRLSRERITGILVDHDRRVSGETKYNARGDYAYDDMTLPALEQEYLGRFKEDIAERLEALNAKAEKPGKEELAESEAPAPETHSKEYWDRVAREKLEKWEAGFESKHEKEAADKERREEMAGKPAARKPGGRE